MARPYTPPRYAVVIFPDADLGGFRAVVPDLPACTAHGTSQHAAVDAIAPAIARYLAQLDDHHLPAPSSEPLSDHWRQEEYQHGEWFFVDVDYCGRVRR